MAELLAVAAIAAYGYYTSYNSNVSDVSYEALGPPNRIRAGHETEVARIRKAHETAAAGRWAAGGSPATTGVVRGRPSDAPVPFFKSAKSMNTRTEYKQRKLETFTGEDTAWAHKAVVEAPPPVSQGFVRSTGIVGNDPTADVTRVVPGRIMNNVLPAQQVRVGPGLGIGPDVAATGGFHQFYRQLPTNVNEHRLNTLPGGVVSGASRIANRAMPVDGAVNHNPDALLWTMDDRPPQATTAGLFARRADGMEPRDFSHRKPLESDRFGIAGKTGPRGQTCRRAAPRLKPRGLITTAPMVNRAASGAGVGAYVGADPHMPPTLRGHRTPAFSGVGTAISGGAVRPSHAPGPTMRDLTGEVRHWGPAMSSALADRVDVNVKQPLGRNTKRAAQLRERFTAPGRMNVMNPSSSGKHRVKRRSTFSALERTHAKAPVQIRLPTEGTTARAGRKSIVKNRLDLGEAARIMATNPFRFDLSDRPMPTNKPVVFRNA
jgi:hypothetical protein